MEEERKEEKEKEKREEEIKKVMRKGSTLFLKNLNIHYEDVHFPSRYYSEMTEACTATDTH